MSGHASEALRGVGESGIRAEAQMGMGFPAQFAQATAANAPAFA